MAPAPTDHDNEQSPAPDQARIEISAPGDGRAEPGEQDALAAACRERDEYYDLLLRKTAEFDNYRKRVERERREQAAFEVSALIETLLPVLDDFERALSADTIENPEAYRAGVQLIYRQFLDLLGRHGVTAIEAVGADFDPRVHQAVIAEPSPAHRDGEVIEEFRRGYRIGDRLLRPAMVKVAKA
jgi:molecular chaperone GrpE